MAEVLRVGGNHPVRIGASTTLYRVQDFSFPKDRNPVRHYQLGTQLAIGTTYESWRYTANMTVNPIDTQTERAFAAVALATDPVTLSALLAAAPVTVFTPDESMTGTVVESIRYTADAPSGTFSAAYTLRGTGEGAGATITAPTTTGLVAFMPKNIYVRSSTLVDTTLMRIRRMEITLNLRSEDWFEFSNPDAFYVHRSEPATTFMFGWYKSTDVTAPGTHNYDHRPMPEPSAPAVFEVQLAPDGAVWDATGNIRIDLPGVTVQRRSRDVRVNSAGGDEINYSADDATTGGFTIDMI